MSEMFTLKGSGTCGGPKRNETVRSMFPVIAIQFPFQPAATCRPANPGGKRVKTVPAIKANFLSLFKSLCVHSSANFTSELVCSKEGGKDREQKGRQEFSSRSLPFTVGQRTVLKWIPIFQGVDLIKRGPDFRDGNILPGRKLRKFGARNIKAVWPKADG